MTEKEKMLAGQLYDAAGDEQLTKDRVSCKDICQRYNQMMPSDTMGREKAIRSLLGKTGKSFWIEQPFWCDYGYNIKIGEDFYTNHNCVILDAAPVMFGDHVFVAPNCGFYTAGHPLDVRRRNAGLEYALPIEVGDNVWIGGNVVVLPGVTIGPGSVIGAGSVVNRDIPAGVVAAGNPCKVIREITDEDKRKYQK